MQTVNDRKNVSFKDFFAKKNILQQNVYKKKIFVSIFNYFLRKENFTKRKKLTQKIRNSTCYLF